MTDDWSELPHLRIQIKPSHPKGIIYLEAFHKGVWGKEPKSHDGRNRTYAEKISHKKGIKNY